MWAVYIDGDDVYVRDTLFETWLVRKADGKWRYCTKPKGISKMYRPARSSKRYRNIVAECKQIIRMCAFVS